MTKIIGFAVLALAAAVPAAYAQDSGSYLIRGRALNLHSANKDSTGLNLSIDNKTFPELDLTYFITPNLATELILTYPQKQKLYSGSTQIGDFKHLPPVLTLQYHFTGLPVRPYVGAGINATFFSDVNLPAGVTIKKTSVGPALDAGVDFPVGGGWLINVDVKKVWLGTDVSAGGAKLGTLKVDPTLFSLGVGYRF